MLRCSLQVGPRRAGPEVQDTPGWGRASLARGSACTTSEFRAGTLIPWHWTKCEGLSTLVQTFQSTKGEIKKKKHAENTEVGGSVVQEARVLAPLQGLKGQRSCPQILGFPPHLWVLWTPPWLPTSTELLAD